MSRFVLLLLLSVIPSLATADTLACDSPQAETTRVGVSESTDGTSVGWTVCSATADQGRSELAVYAAVNGGEPRQLVQTMADGDATEAEVALGGGTLLIDFPCLDDDDQMMRCVRVYAARSGQLRELQAEVWSAWTVGAQRLEMRLAEGDIEGARGIAMRMGAPPPGHGNAIDRVFLAFLQSAWVRARGLESRGDLRGATEQVLALLAQPPILSPSGPSDPGKLTLRPGVGAYAISGVLQVAPNPAIVTRLVDCAGILTRGGERRRASEVLDEVVRVVPKNTAAWLALGDVQWAQRLKRQAAASYASFTALAQEDGTVVPERVAARLEQ